MDNYAGSPLTPQRRRGCGNAHSSVAALILIGVGVLLFLENLGVLPFLNLRAYWPLAISAFGVAGLVKQRSGGAIIWSLTIVAFGVILTLGNLGMMHANMGTLWPLWLIAAGASMLVKRTGFGPPSRFSAAASVRANMTDNQVRENAAFSSIEKRIDSLNFEGADLNSTFGEIKLDLRGCTISTASREAIIDANASFGAIKLRVPETWRVLVRGNAVFGSYEDKTIPPRPGPGVDPPTLIIRGNSSFGSVEIEN